MICVQRQIFNEVDHTAIIMLLTALSKIVTLSEQKEETIQKKKKRKNRGANATKINVNLRAYEDYDRILKSI